MFNSSISQLFKPGSDGRYADMDNMDMMLNYENNEFMSSDFFDTIRSVENEIQDDLLNSADELLTSSDTSSHIDGYISPRNDISESERSSIFTDDSVSPLRSVETIDESLFDFLQTQDNFEVEPTPVIIKSSKPSKIIIQNPATLKKIVNKPILSNSTTIKKIGKKQILKVQSLTANGKPVILPYGLNSIKILNASDLKTDRIQLATIPASAVCRRKVESTRLRDDTDSNVPVNDLSEVKLTSEEKRLLDKEGIQLPSYHPLTKMEDRELKRIRRKIRNKISAQDSRKRKKEYVDGLEERVRRGSEENRNLLQRVKELQKKNKTLMAHINKLQSLIFKSSSSKATPSTCLMIVMLSVLLVSLPNIRLPHNKELSTEQEQVTISRSLLSTKKVEADEFNMEEFFVFNKDDESADSENNTEEIFKSIEEMESKYEGNMHFEKDKANNDNFLNTFMTNVKRLFSSSELGSYFSADYGGLHNKKGFIEPDIDDFDPGVTHNGEDPPAKRMKLVDDFHHQNDENFVPFNKNQVVSATVQTNNLAESKDK